MNIFRSDIGRCAIVILFFLLFASKDQYHTHRSHHIIIVLMPFIYGRKIIRPKYYIPISRNLATSGTVLMRGNDRIGGAEFRLLHHFIRLFIIDRIQFVVVDGFS